MNRRVEQDVKNQEILEQHLLQEKIVKLQKAREQQKKRSEEDKIESFAEYSKHLNNGISANNTKPEPMETEIASSSNSSSSTNSLPPVYYNLHDDEQRRPKSATQIIKRHLELEAVHRKSPIRLISSNKTVPISIYGLKLPKSADEKRRRFKAQRNLKSAGDCGLIGSDMPQFFAGAAGDGALHRQLFELNHFSKVGKNGPKKGSRTERKNSISVVEVD